MGRQNNAYKDTLRVIDERGAGMNNGNARAADGNRRRTGNARGCDRPTWCATGNGGEAEGEQ